MMAIVNKVLVSAINHDDPTQLATLSIDYDDTDFRVRAVHCVNDTDRQARLVVERTDGTRTYGPFFVEPRTTRDETIPTQTATRLQLTVDPRGRLDGIDYQFGLVG